MPCLDCLDDSKTLIQAPECLGDCPDDLGCVDIVNSNCVIVNPALPCVNQTSGVNLSTALQAIDAKLCQNSSNVNSCKVKVSATDTCCDFLEPKITVANGLIKTKTGGTPSCETVQISHPTWNTVNFTAPLLSPAFSLGIIGGLNTPKAHTYFTGTQRVHEVKLTGLISVNLDGLPLNFKNNLTKLTSLPLGIPAPKEDYFCSYSKVLLGGNVMIAEIVIGGQLTLAFDTGGIYVQIFSSPSDFNQSYFSLVGIIYHILLTVILLVLLVINI